MLAFIFIFIFIWFDLNWSDSILFYFFLAGFLPLHYACSAGSAEVVKVNKSKHVYKKYCIISHWITLIVSYLFSSFSLFAYFMSDISYVEIRFLFTQDFEWYRRYFYADTVNDKCIGLFFETCYSQNLNIIVDNLRTLTLTNRKSSASMRIW